MARTPQDELYNEIEGQFHHSLGTLAELLIANEIISVQHLRQPLFEEARHREDINRALARLPPRLAHKAPTLQSELTNVEAAARRAAIHLLALKPLLVLAEVRHTAAIHGGRAADLVLVWSDGSESPVSVKTLKYPRLAIAELGQTPSIPLFAEVFYQFTEDELNRLCEAELGMSVPYARAHYRDTAHLLQHIVLRALEIEGAVVNDWSGGRPTRLDRIQHLLREVRRKIHGEDNSLLVILSRQDGSCGSSAQIDSLDVEALELGRVSFSPCRGVGGYCTEIAIKVDNRRLLTHQVKHQRNPRTEAFRDITTRVNA